MASATRIDELTARYAENPRRYFAPLANEYRKLGDPERAIALCRVHLPSQPGHMSGHIVLGQSLFDAGELPAARAAFAAGVALDDENLVALRRLGDIARLEGDLPEARSWYARVLDADPLQSDVAALQESLGRELAAREADADDATVVAAAAEDQPLPAPTTTPFPGGIGFSEEELDAFIAHVPIRPEAGEAGEAGEAPPEAADAAPAVAPVAEAPASDGPTPDVHDAADAELPMIMAALEAPADVESVSELPGAGLPMAPDASARHDPRDSATPSRATEPVAEASAEALWIAGGAVVGPSAAVELPELHGTTADIDGARASSDDLPAAPSLEATDGVLPSLADEQAGEGITAFAPDFATDAGYLTPVSEWMEATPDDDSAMPVVDVETLAPDDAADGLAPLPFTVQPGDDFDDGLPALGATPAAAESTFEPHAVDVVDVVDDTPAEPVATAPTPEVAAPVDPTRTPVRVAAFELLASLAPWRDGTITPPPGVAVDAADVSAIGDLMPDPATPEVPLASLGEWGRHTPPVVEAAEAEPEGAVAALPDDAPQLEPAEPTRDPSAATPAFADEPPRPVYRPTPSGFSTATMAELYRQQGFLAESLAVYRDLAARHPDVPAYAANVEALEKALGAAPQVPHQTDGVNVLSEVDFGLASEDPSETVGTSRLTPPGFPSISAELASTGVPGPAAHAPSADGDWFATESAERGDDWFGDVVPSEDTSVDTLFGMDDQPIRAAAATPMSLDLLGAGGLDDLFGVPVIAASDETASQWLERLGVELVARVNGMPETLPVPDALDAPQRATASSANAPGPLLSFDRFFGPTPPGVRAQVDPMVNGGLVPPRAPTPSLGPSFGGAPVLTPRAPEPVWPGVAAPPAPPAPAVPSAPPPASQQPAPPASDAQASEPGTAPDGPPRPKSDFHRWLEGLS
jgi:hypothetical protein